MTVFKTPPDYIALILSIGIITILTMGMAAESPLMFNNKRILNFNYIVNLFYLASFFFEGYIFNYYTPNYQYIKLLFPIKLKRQFFIDLLIEIFSYKIFLILFSILGFFIFSKTYKIVFWSGLNLLGLFLIILSYINSCLLIIAIKNKMKRDAFNFRKNFFKLFLFFMALILIINQNRKLIDFDSIKTFYTLLIASIILTIVLILIIFRITIKEDKI